MADWSANPGQINEGDGKTAGITSARITDNSTVLTFRTPDVRSDAFEASVTGVLNLYLNREEAAAVVIALTPPDGT